MKFNLQNKISAAAFLILPAVFLMTTPVYGKVVKPEDEKLKFTGDWEVRGNVNKLYDTPLGGVYDFTISDYFNFAAKYVKEAQKGRYALHSIQFDLQKNIPRGEKLRRFIVLDFKIRTFPALTTVKNPTLTFALTRSAADPANINNYLSLNGISRYERLWPVMSPPLYSPYWNPGNSVIPSWVLDLDRGCFPYYEVNACRVIFDTYSGGISSTNINADKYIAPHMENVSVPIRTLGLCVQINEDDKKIQYRQLVEVSRPLITLTDREEALRDLKPLESMTDYPYGGYAEELKKLSAAANPDLIYAYGMRFLESGDLPLGVELLKKAAAKQHIFAMYQLGVCYYRGIGVEPDLQKALTWLKYASDYDLPDAWALAAIVQMYSSKSIYASNYIRGSVKQSMHALKFYAEKHDNRVQKELFNNDGCSHIDPDYVACSPKLAFLVARRSYMDWYYKDNVDPKLIPPEPVAVKRPPDYKFKPIAFSPELKNAVKSRNSAEIDIGAPTDLIENRLPDKYYDLRVLKSWQGDALINRDRFEMGVAANYVPALLYSGRQTSKFWKKDKRKYACSGYQRPFGPPVTSPVDALEKAGELFSLGAKAGSRECEVEALCCRARLGKLKKEDFTAELDVRLADSPLYHMLKYMAENPDAPGARDFLEMEYESARQSWRDNPSAWNSFLLGAELLYQYYDYGYDTAWYRLYYRDVKDLETAFKYLDDAAKQNIAPALYLCGKQFLEGSRSKGQMDEILHRKIGTDLLKSAAQAGCVKASYLLARQHCITNIYSTDEKWLEELKPALDAKDADSWLLAGDIYSRLKSPGNDKKALESYAKAAELGSLRAWHALGMRHYNKPSVGKEKEQNKLKAAECWRKFVKLDREARSQDINDVYWPDIKKPQVFKFEDRDYSTQGLSDKQVRRYYETY